MFNIKIFESILMKQVERGELSETTKDGYVRCIRNLELKCGNKIDDLSQSAGILEKSIGQLCKSNQQINKYISAIKKYEKDILKSPGILLFGEPLIRLRSNIRCDSESKTISCSEETYSHKVNAIRDNRMKSAFRLQRQSGLRVSEIAALKKSDISFEKDGSMKLFVRNGKGGKSRIVTVGKDEYLLRQMKQSVLEVGEEERLFPTAAAMKKKAYELGMETHDLRRINSRQRFRENLSEGYSRREARSAVSRELGHSNTKITNLYLGGEWSGGGAEDEQSET